MQRSKIRALGIASWFEGVLIDPVDEPHHEGKQAVIERILDREGCQPEAVMVIGDNP